MKRARQKRVSTWYAGGNIACKSSDLLRLLPILLLVAGCSQGVSSSAYNNEIPKALLLSREQVLETLVDLEEVRRAIKANSKDAQLHYKAGHLERRLERWDNALRDFQMAITRNSKFVEAYYYAGFVAEKLGESYEVNPDYNADARNVSGTMRRYALDSYKKALKLKPNYTDALHRLGLAYALNNDLRRALETYHRLNELEPGTNRTKELLSRVYDLQQAQMIQRN